MIKWQYQVLMLDGRDVHELNSEGANGWELVALVPVWGLDRVAAYFKRLVQETGPNTVQVLTPDGKVPVALVDAIRDALLANGLYSPRVY